MQELENTSTQIKGLEESNKQEKEQREAAEKARREAEVNRFLSRVAVEEDAVDPVAVERYFMPQIEWENGQLMLRKDKDTLVDAQTGIKDMFPAYLKKSRAPGDGGAGSGGHLPNGDPKPTEDERTQEITNLRAQAEEIKTKYQKEGGPMNILAERRALLRKADELEQEKNTAAA